jgi:hypothetical protein
LSSILFVSTTSSPISSSIESVLATDTLQRCRKSAIGADTLILGIPACPIQEWRCPDYHQRILVSKRRKGGSSPCLIDMQHRFALYCEADVSARPISAGREKLTLRGLATHASRSQTFQKEMACPASLSEPPSFLFSLETNAIGNAVDCAVSVPRGPEADSLVRARA